MTVPGSRPNQLDLAFFLKLKGTSNSKPSDNFPVNERQFQKQVVLAFYKGLEFISRIMDKIESHSSGAGSIAQG